MCFPDLDQAAALARSPRRPRPREHFAVRRVPPVQLDPQHGLLVEEFALLFGDLPGVGHLLLQFGGAGARLFEQRCLLGVFGDLLRPLEEAPEVRLRFHVHRHSELVVEGARFELLADPLGCISREVGARELEPLLQFFRQRHDEFALRFADATAEHVRVVNGLRARVGGLGCISQGPRHRQNLLRFREELGSVARPTHALFFPGGRRILIRRGQDPRLPEPRDRKNVERQSVANHLPLQRVDGAGGEARRNVLEVLPVRDLLRVLRASGLHQAAQIVRVVLVAAVLIHVQHYIEPRQGDDAVRKTGADGNGARDRVLPRNPLPTYDHVDVGGHAPQILGHWPAQTVEDVKKRTSRIAVFSFVSGGAGRSPLNNCL